LIGLEVDTVDKKVKYKHRLGNGFSQYKIHVGGSNSPNISMILRGMSSPGNQYVYD
jgi:hypothetical protein